MNLKYLFYTCILFLFGQIGVWFQLNSQFIWDWAKKNPLLLTILGLPFTYLFILATSFGQKAFDGLLWPGRFIGFGVGMVVYAVFTGYFFNEGISPKTMVSLGLAVLLISVQLFME